MGGGLLREVRSQKAYLSKHLQISKTVVSNIIFLLYPFFKTLTISLKCRFNSPLKNNDFSIIGSLLKIFRYLAAAFIWENKGNTKDKTQTEKIKNTTKKKTGIARYTSNLQAGNLVKIYRTFSFISFVKHALGELTQLRHIYLKMLSG